MSTRDAVLGTVPAGWSYAGPLRGTSGRWLADLVGGQPPYLVSAEGDSEPEAINRAVQSLLRQQKEGRPP